MNAALRVLYDLTQAPVTFDFAAFLSGADCARQLLKLEGIDLTISTAGYRNRTERDIETASVEKDWRVQNILIPVTQILPSIKSVSVTPNPKGPFDYPFDGQVPYLIPDIVKLMKRGANPRVFKAPAFAHYFLMEAQGYITLSPRQSKHFTQRNADIVAWAKFAQYLGAKGHKVVAIPDIEDLDACAPLAPWMSPISIVASSNLPVRMALYEKAKLNVIGATGVTWPLKQTDRPYLEFDHMRGNVFTPEEWKRLCNMEVGQQMPWALPNQRMTWKDSTFENLTSEFERFEHDLLESKAG